MTDRSVPHPMPAAMRDQVNGYLYSGSDLSSLDRNQRFILRKLVATAYAVGYADASTDHLINDGVDN